MPSVSVSKSHATSKCRSCGTNNISLDTSQVSIRMSNGHSYENTPSPSSVTSTSTIEQSPKFRPRILSSTLKSDYPHLLMKRRTRYDKLFHYTQTINRQYMMTMTNVLFQMQKEIYKLRRRTHRVEQLVIKQAKAVQPIIRIPRLTKDQLSTICITNDEENVLQENEVIPDDNNNNIAILPTTKTTTTKIIKRLNKHKHRKGFGRRGRPPMYVNNRQKPFDADRYCTICRYQYARRSYFVQHVKTIHNGKRPPRIDEQDQSLLEMNEENIERNSSEHIDQSKNEEKTNDQSVGLFDNETEPSIEQWDVNDARLRRPRTTPKTDDRKIKRSKLKCDICKKIYGADYLKKHQIRAHPDHEIVQASNEINNNSNQLESISEKVTDQSHLSNGNHTPTDTLHVQNVGTPTNITIADMDMDDVPIRFRTESNQSLVIAVTCLESQQIELVNQFLEKFSTQVCQTSSIDSRTTHLITNDAKGQLRSPLSMKLIEAIAHHCFCVSYRWIAECLKHNRLVDEEPFEIEGDDTDIHPHGGPHRSRLIGARHSLFQNICFMIKCTEKSDIQMTNERLEDLITTCGGQIITCVTQRLLDKYQIVVLCDMLYVSERRPNYDQCRALGIQFVSSDWVLESILEYRIKPFSLFEEVPC